VPSYNLWSTYVDHYYLCLGRSLPLLKSKHKNPTPSMIVIYVKHCLVFSFVFSAPFKPARRNLFSASRIFCCGSYQLGCTGIFWPAEGTSQLVTIFKKWKNPSSALYRKRTFVQALPWFFRCSFGLPALGTDLKSQKGQYSGPSPVHIFRFI